MKTNFLLLFLMIASSGLAQTELAMPNLSAVYKSFENNFQPIKGEFLESRLPDSVYSSKVIIERSNDNQIRKVPGKGYVYIAFLGVYSSSQKADQAAYIWKGILTRLAKGYSVKSEKMPNLKGENISHLFEKKDDNNRYTINVFYNEVESSGQYSVCLVFINSKTEGNKQKTNM